MNTRHWDASECTVVLTDYQDHILDGVFEQDRRANRGTTPVSCRKRQATADLCAIPLRQHACGP